MVYQCLTSRAEAASCAVKESKLLRVRGGKQSAAVKKLITLQNITAEEESGNNFTHTAGVYFST